MISKNVLRLFLVSLTIFFGTAIADYSYESQDLNQRGSVSVPYDIQLSLPLFKDIPLLNKVINDSKSGIINEFYSASMQIAVNHSDKSPSLSNRLNGTFVIKRDDTFKSIVVKLMEFHSPAAHPIYSLHTFNYDVNTGRCVHLPELFKDKQSLVLLAKLSQKKLLKNYPHIDTQPGVFFNTTQYNANNYQYWSLNQKNLIIYFWYTISGTSDGQQTVTFSGQELDSLLSNYGRKLLKP